MLNFRFLTGLLLALLLTACADRDGSDDALPGDAHPENWPGIHGEAFSTVSECTPCHGQNLDGGIVGVACSDCHRFGSAPDFSVHPPDWSDPRENHRQAGQEIDWDGCAAAACHGPELEGGSEGPSCFSANFTNDEGLSRSCHPGSLGAPHAEDFSVPSVHGPVAKQDLTLCQACHAQRPDTEEAPRFNRPLGILQSGCEDCHLPFTAHAVPWVQELPRSHATAGRLEAACTLCHAEEGAASPRAEAPVCTECHLDSPIAVSGCASCHGAPPGGTAAPNRDGAHLAHDAVSGQAGSCSTCHFGLGSGTDSILNGTVDVALDPAYDAAGAVATFVPQSGSCSGVSCHRGTTTSAWQNGALDVDQECLECHQTAIITQTGQHAFHLNLFPQTERHPCTPCHAPERLATGHFVGLNTPQFETDPATSLNLQLLYEPVIQRCTPEDGGLTGCHGAEDWQP